MSTHMPGFQSFFSFSYHFVIAKLAISSIRVNKARIPRIQVNIHLIFFSESG